MAYVKRKHIKEHDYYYLVETYRDQDKVKTRTLAYLGREPEVPKELAHLLTQPRRRRQRRRQRTFWDPVAVGAAIARRVQRGPVKMKKSSKS